MRITLTILFLFYFGFSFTQSKTSIQKDNFNQTDRFIDTSSVHYDTLGIQTDTLNITTQTKIIENIIVLDKKNDKSGFLAIFLPIFYILLGIGINKLLDYLKDKKEIKQSGNRWIAELRCLEQPIKNQIKALENFRVEMRKDNTEYPQMPFYSILNCDVFKTLDKDSLLKFIQHKYKDYNEAIFKSNSIHGFISVLAHLYDNLMKKANTFQQDYESLMNSLNENIDIILREFGNYGVALEKKLNGDPVNDYRYKPIAEILFKYIDERPDNIFTIEKNYLLPLLACLSHLRLEPDLKKMTDSVARVLQIIKKLKTKRKQIDFETGDYIKGYKEQEGELGKVVKPIEL
jgi:hypothetical protein